VLIYGALLFWAFVLPVSDLLDRQRTSFKSALDVDAGHLAPWLDFQPDWKGWRSLGLSPDSIPGPPPRATIHEPFRKQHHHVGRRIRPGTRARIIGGYGLSRFRYKFGWMRNDDILFFFMSQLILPPVVLALPFLVLYKALSLLDTRLA